jgi:hypothetical protein
VKTIPSRIAMAFFAVGALACSSSSSPGVGTSDAGTSACNSLTNDGQPVLKEQVAKDPPSPAGGVIADGHYVLTGYTTYTGPGGATGTLTDTLRLAVTISGSGTKLLVVMSADGNADEHTAWTQATTGNALTHTQDCPATGQVDPATFTAGPNELTWYFASGGKTEAWTLTRR